MFYENLSDLHGVLLNSGIYIFLKINIKIFLVVFNTEIARTRLEWCKVFWIGCVSVLLFVTYLVQVYHQVPNN